MPWVAPAEARFPRFLGKFSSRDRGRSHQAPAVYKKADQFAPEILYFSDCILKGKEPEPSALEGMNDVKVILAIHESLRTNKPVKVSDSAPVRGPKVEMKKRVPGHPEPALVNAKGATN